MREPEDWTFVRAMLVILAASVIVTTLGALLAIWCCFPLDGPGHRTCEL